MQNSSIQTSSRGPLTPEELARRIVNANASLVLSVTGGGSAAIASLSQTPGASRILCEAIVPYSAASLIKWLGATPEQFCSERTARAMAWTAWRRACELNPARDPPAAPPPIGVACSASLASTREKRGAHRIHVAAQTRAATTAWSVKLVKGRRSRLEEEAVATALVMNLVAEILQLDAAVATGLQPDEPVQRQRCEAPEAWRKLAAREIDVVGAALDDIRGVLPGAFNPLHAAHHEMARITAERIGGQVAFEISIENVDKLPLDYCEMTDRAAQFAGSETLLFTRAATFAEKSRILPDRTWIVGADTIVRIADPRYYASEAARDAALTDLEQSSARFLVFGRAADGAFHTLAELNLPAPLARLCEAIPESDFRMDITSTGLRNSHGGS